MTKEFFEEKLREHNPNRITPSSAEQRELQDIWRTLYALIDGEPEIKNYDSYVKVLTRIDALIKS